MANFKDYATVLDGKMEVEVTGTSMTDILQLVYQQ
jgi:hypothetical protein